MTSGDNAPRDRPADDQWSYPWPGGAPGGGGAEEEPADPEAVPMLLCTLPAAQAAALCARLESEGIPCSLGVEDLADSSPPAGDDDDDGGPVDVFVEASVLEA